MPGPNLQSAYTLERIAADIFDALGNPKGGPNLIGSIYQRLLGRLNHYSTLVETFGGNWIVARYSFNLVEGKDEYAVTEPNFTRPLCCETAPQSAQNVGGGGYYLPMPIDVVNLEDLARYGAREYSSLGVYGEIVGDLVGGRTVPRAVAYYQDNSGGQNIPTLRFSCPARSDARLRMFYRPSVLTDFDPAIEPQFLRSFLELLVNATAQRALPLFVKEMDPVEYAALKEDLKMIVEKDEALLVRYIANDHVEVAGPIRGWGQNRADRSPFNL